MANNVRRYGLSRLQASRSPFAPASAFRNKAPHLPRRFVRHKTGDPCTANPPPCSGAHCAPQTCGPVRREAAAGHTFRPGPAAGAANGPRDSRTARDFVQCAQDPALFVVRMANGETARAGAPAWGGQSSPAGMCMPERVGCPPGAAIPARRGQKCPALSGCPGPAGSGRAAGCPEAPPECPAPCCRTPSTGTSPPPAAARPAHRPPRCPGPCG